VTTAPAADPAASCTCDTCSTPGAVVHCSKLLKGWQQAHNVCSGLQHATSSREACDHQFRCRPAWPSLCCLLMCCCTKGTSGGLFQADQMDVATGRQARNWGACTCRSSPAVHAYGSAPLTICSTVHCWRRTRKGRDHSRRAAATQQLHCGFAQLTRASCSFMFRSMSHVDAKF
jgi:hypothetical protein